MFASVSKALRSKIDGRDAWSFTRSMRHAVLFLPRLIERQSSRAIKARKKRLAKQSAATHFQPTIELLDVRQIGSLVANGIAGVAVVMPCIDAKIDMNTARLLACR